MFHSKVHIEFGDLVILFMTNSNMTAITVTAGEVYHNKYGRYPHEDMVGQKFGSKIHSPPPHSGYLHLLRPTPELWTLSLSHRTQILYMPDIAYITMRLGIRVGGKVVEAGTGSGSMTHALARTVGTRGTVNSFEYHRMRYEKAEEEFADHGLTQVHLQHRNVCKDGFGVLTNIEAVFLDLPAPWEAIPHAVKILRPDLITKICCFSPCLEQVLKTVSTLRAEGFYEISTQEVLVRNHDLVPAAPPTSSHLHDISAIIKRLKDHETRKEARRIIQMRTAREKLRRDKEKAEAKNDLAEAEADDANVAPEIGVVDKRKLEGDAAEDERIPKRSRIDGDTLAEGDAESLGDSARELPKFGEDGAKAVVGGDTSSIARPSIIPKTVSKPDTPVIWSEPETTLRSQILTKPSAEMRGHTSYLTFASFYPAAIRTQIAAQEKPVSLRVATLVKEGGDAGIREGSAETEYGDDGLDTVMGTLTEDEMVALAAGGLTE